MACLDGTFSEDTRTDATGVDGCVCCFGDLSGHTGCDRSFCSVAPWILVVGDIDNMDAFGSCVVRGSILCEGIWLHCIVRVIMLWQAALCSLHCRDGGLAEFWNDLPG